MTRILQITWFAICAFMLAPLTSHADPADWLIEGSTLNPETETAEYLSGDTPLQGRELLGKLLFNSATLLGEKATRIGLSCNSCHPSGHRNASFFIPGLSDKAGRIDMSHSFWHEGGSDAIFNPLEIPSLRGAAHSAPYGSAVNKPTLSDFTHHVITAEFGGPAPSPETLDALSSYMKRLQIPTSNTRAAPPASFARYLELLKEPLAAGDSSKLARLIYLLREDLGRRAVQEPQNPAYANTAQTLRQIGGFSSADRKPALTKLQELQANLSF